MTGRTVRVDAFAKLTLALRIVGVRPDGYHDLEALAVSVSAPCDALALALGPGGVSLSVGGPAADGVPADATNLVVRAATALLARADAGSGVDVRLHKSIPAGAGLGGGSADAAAVLVGLRTLLALDVDDAVLAEVAAELGSDVPFCVGGGAAWMRGRGERLEPTRVPGLAVVVVVPPFACSTPAVYRAWDDLGGPAGHAVAPPEGLTGGLPPLVNDLEPAAERVEPRLAPFRADLERAVGVRPLLAGSGSSYALLFARPAAAAAAADRARAVPGARVFLGAVAPAGVVLRP